MRKIPYPVLAVLSMAFVWPDLAAALESAQVRKLGLEARLYPELRDARMQELAAQITELGPVGVHPLQGDFQYALLLQCDPEIYDTLAPETIEAVDDALEGLFSLDDIDRDNHWEPLIYAYGFFNRDVTPESIQRVISTWEGLTDDEKAPRYPTYIHVIDAVTKPVSMGLVGDRATTGAVLGLVAPALKEQFLLPPKPGTAFHPPSHACLVLGPLYERWIDDPDFGPILRDHFGDRAAFEALLASQLAGARESATALSHTEYGYYAYIGSYLANTLARLNARSAVPALSRSMEVYRAHGAKGRVVAYTDRALLALGEADHRATFEVQLGDPALRDSCKETLAWLARNGQGETRDFAMERLGALFGCAPKVALSTYFSQLIP